MSSATDAKIAEFAGKSLNDIEDAPGYRTPKPSRLKLQLDFEFKSVNDKPAFIANAKVLEVLEMKDDSDEKPLVGDMFSVMYTEQGMSFSDSKKVIRKMTEIAGVESGAYGQLVNNTIIVEAVIANRADKNDAEKVYASFKSLEAAS